MAMVRDLFGGYPLVKMLSRLALVSGLAPVLAPVIGSQLLLAVDWRGMFVFLSIYGFLVLVATALFLRETLEPAARSVRGHSLGPPALRCAVPRPRLSWAPCSSPA